MVAFMQRSPITPLRKRCRCLAMLLLLPAGHAALAGEGASRPEQVQKLIYGEILFHARQQEYAKAITELLIAYEQGTLPPVSDETKVLLARLKLAYGLDVEAGYALHDLQAEGLPGPVSNRAWYELARTFFQKGYVNAAQEALDQIRGALPEDLRGEHQLLVAQVLMAQGKNEQAAGSLQSWRGAPELAGFAHYNRGIALVRSGKYAQAITALEQVTAMDVKGEELLALRDKANLTLGYAFAQLDDLEDAKVHLQQVRLHGPFTNRALLALGWVDRNQGRDADALVPWTELRSRSTADPAVLESILIVPFMHRELASLPAAIRDYKSAVSTLTDELQSLGDTRQSVKQGALVNTLLNKRPGGESADGQPSPADAAAPDARYFGPLLASRHFQQAARGYHDLRSLLDSIDKGLDNLNRLAQHVDRTPDSGFQPGGTAPLRSSNAAPGAEPDGVANTGRVSGSHTSSPQWVDEWESTEGQQQVRHAPGIPVLPQIELPPDRTVMSPQSEFTGLPEPDFLGLPAAPDTSGLQDPEIIAYPESEILRLPDSGKVRLPFQDDDYAYPDYLARDEVRNIPPTKRRIRRRIGQYEMDAGERAASAPAGTALQGLAAELARAAERLAVLGQSTDSPPENLDFAQRLASLRERITQLRKRIIAAIQLDERYARALALAELEQRENRLKDLLEQANLGLAKTYDQATEH
jgi:tetratricopeptide (TPR) repeat protein